ncbi:hypothetical protein [Agrobacterium tumefaciens]|uniref:hypothetical protein n=1 Tax=Agrobacterium tumefaciens TaxID=358 RepID=UPI00287D7585|nr:hypothetical protein [Agrobacterium tumefaciens]MDS7598423.1 hypothetical protein [Agrobacterium tumefaciens]
MVAFSPTAFAEFLTSKDDKAVIVMNLLRFDPDGGRERHLVYLTLAEPILARFGTKILFRGDGLPILTGSEIRKWDPVLLVQSPGRVAFKAMVDDAEYQHAFEVGASALADIVLQSLTMADDLI